MRCRPPSRSPAAPASAAPGRRASGGPRSSRSARNLSAAASHARGTFEDVPARLGPVLPRGNRTLALRRALWSTTWWPPCTMCPVANQEVIRAGPGAARKRRAPRNHSANRGAVPGSAFRAPATVTGPGSRGQAGESPGSGDGRSPAWSQDCKGDLGVKRRRGIQVRRVSKGTECDCHG